MTGEINTADYGLLRQDDYKGGPSVWTRSFEDWARKFHFPQVTDARLLFTPVYAWSFFDPVQAYERPHPLSVFRRNAPLPVGMCGELSWCHWPDYNGGTGLCYAVKPVAVSEAQASAWGMRWGCVLTEAARRGCDGGQFEAVRLINWSHDRTLVIVVSRIAEPWVTLVATPALTELMATAERLTHRPL